MTKRGKERENQKTTFSYKSDLDAEKNGKQRQ